MQDDSLDKIVSPFLQHNNDAAKHKGTAEKKQSKIAQGKKLFLHLWTENYRLFGMSSELHF